MQRFPRPRRLARFLGLALGIVVTAACSQQPAPQTAATTGRAATAGDETPADRAKVADAGAPAVTPAAQTGAGKVAPAKSDTSLEPPDGVWLKDGEGNEYFLYELRKQGTFTRVDDTHIQIQYGLVLEVAKEDENTFWIKIYRQAAGGTAAPPPPAPAVAPAEAAKDPMIATSDRLTFYPFQSGLPQRGQWRNGFQLVDWNHDGHLDIVHGPQRKGRAAPNFFLGDGAGGWRQADEGTFPGGLDYGDVAVADFNGDGHLDLAFAVHLRGILVTVAAGDGTYVPWSTGITYARPERHQGRAAFSSRRIEAVDWNGDGRMDLLALGEGASLDVEAGFAAGASGPRVFLNRGDGKWDEVILGSDSRRPSGDDFAIGDVDGDGRLDVVTASGFQGQRNLLYLSQPDGSARQVELTALRSNAVFRGVKLADFDGDGRLDVAFGYASREGEGWHSGVDVLFNRAGGAWERRAVRVQDGPAGPWAIAVGDLDADGNHDLVAVTEKGGIWVFLGDGKGGFTSEQGTELASPGENCTGFHVALADLDGKPGDELVASFAGEPGSEQIFLDSTLKYCPSRGSLSAWRATRK